MYSRLVSNALPMRTITRTAAVDATQCSKPPKVEYVNCDATDFAILSDGMMELPTKVLSSPTIAIAKLVSHQMTTSTPPSSSLSRPVDVFANAFEDDRKPEKLSETTVFSEQHSKIAGEWEPVGKGLWLERAGGPGKTMEKVAGDGTVVLRDSGLDGKGYLRILI